MNFPRKLLKVIFTMGDLMTLFIFYIHFSIDIINPYFLLEYGFLVFKM